MLGLVGLVDLWNEKKGNVLPRLALSQGAGLRPREYQKRQELDMKANDLVSACIGQLPRRQLKAHTEHEARSPAPFTILWPKLEGFIRL